MQRLPLYRKITSCFSKFNATRFHRFSSSSNTISNDFNNVKTVIIPLHKRHYFRIEGRDTFKFLQGLITNDMNLLQEEEDCLACAILSPKGRVVADIFAYNTTAPTDDQQSVLLEIHAAQSQSVMKYLTMYKLRSKIKIIAKHGDYKSFFTPLPPSDVRLLMGEGRGGIVSADPRADGFGTRILFGGSEAEDASIPPGLLATSSSAQDKSDMPGEEGGKGFTLAPPGFYRSLCLLWGLGEGAELEGRIPLEVNLDLTRHISFSKGCYLGQELSARTKYKGVVRKRLVPLVLFDKTPVTSSALPPLSSVLGTSSPLFTDSVTAPSPAPDSECFSVMTASDREALLKYLRTSGNGSHDSESRSADSSKSNSCGGMKHRIHGQEGSPWVDEDELAQWDKLKIFQSSVAGSGEEEKAVGKVVCVDDHYNQEKYRLGLGLVNLSSLTTGGDDSISSRRSFSILNEQFGWSVAACIFRPPWWPTVDPVTDKPILPE